MANQGAKKRKDENEKHMQRLQQLIVTVNAIYILVRLSIFFSTFTWRHWVGLVISTFAYKTCFDQLASLAEPSFDDAGGLLDGGADLSMGGMCAYLHDIIYITAFVQVASILSDWFWLVYLVIPGFGLWKLWEVVLYPYFFTKTEPGHEDPREKKRREKQERKAERAAKLSKGR
eukprot:TRINITY_DN19785_c0_g1_i1.p1 TRINITY_DN19785_c0_g1~~TRINITY_DN19785_c0_g1_i1.p1  ORF type:complete len:174 (+),score=20.94 TRINITY_DN19785_c0_g1_i1:94-615(+)